MEWQPRSELLEQIALCLHSTLSHKKSSEQRDLERTSPDFDNYICYLLVHDNALSKAQNAADKIHNARSAAGIMLKNDVKTHFASMTIQTRDFIKANVVTGLSDSNAQIRNFCGNVITEVIKQGRLQGWPSLLPNLADLANSTGQSTYAAEGAMTTLLKICEDHKKALNKLQNGQRMADFLVPRLIELMTNVNPKIRANAVSSLHVFLEDRAESLLSHLGTYLERLFGLANDSNSDVKRRICRSIVRSTEVAPSTLHDHMKDLVQYMLSQQQNGQDEELALEAAEFWLMVSEDSNLRSAIIPYLSNIVPVLLESMVYADDDIIRLEAEAEEDDTVDDRSQDVKPRFAVTKASRGNTNGNYSGDLSDGEIEESDEDGDEDPEEEWNVRKCSAASLDNLSLNFPEDVFKYTLPYLKLNLAHEHWPHREAAVLTTGAIAEGCMLYIAPHLPDLIPFMISLLDDKVAVVRKVACWSLGRYSSWVLALQQDKERFFVPMMDGLLRRMLDGNKRVQESAAGSFARLTESTNDELGSVDYCRVIVQQFSKCFERYKDRNMLALYDCVQALADRAGPTLQEPSLSAPLMKALTQRWTRVTDQSLEIFPLLECLSYVAAALGRTFLPYAEPIFTRSIRMLASALETTAAAVANPDIDAPDQDFLITNLDMISALFQALDESDSSRLVADSQPHLLDILPLCLEDQHPDTRRSAFALLGDTAVFAFPTLLPHLDKIIPLIVSQLDLEKISQDPASGYTVANNVCWSSGEISLRAGSRVVPWADFLLQGYFSILTNERTVQAVGENAAVALGRLAGACPQELAQHLPLFAPPLLRTIGPIAWTEEKASALSGFARTVGLNPQGLENCLLDFLAVIALASEPVNDCKEIVAIYKQRLPNFEDYITPLPAEVQNNFRRLYSS